MKEDKERQTRKHRKEVQYSDTEFDIVSRKAVRAGLNLAEYIRESSLHATLNEALTPTDKERIDRACSIPYKMQVNLNQIARLGNIHGKDFIGEAVLEFIRRFDCYVETGEYLPMDLSVYESQMKLKISQSSELARLKEQLSVACKERDEAKGHAMKYFLFSGEGIDYFKKKYKCSLYYDNAGINLYIKVGDYAAYALPEQIKCSYINKDISIADVYNYWERHSNH